MATANLCPRVLYRGHDPATCDYCPSDPPRARLSAGRTYRILATNRWGKPCLLGGLLVTLAAVYDPIDGLDECSGFVHCARATMEAMGYPSNTVQFSADELEAADGEEYACPSCGAMVVWARGLPHGALLFAHDNTGHVLEGL